MTTTIFGENEQALNNVGIDELDSPRQTLFPLCIDASGSMHEYVDAMEDCLKTLKNSIANSKASEEMLISRYTFSNQIDVQGYQLCYDLDTSYDVGGYTRLYDAIVMAQQNLIVSNYDEDGDSNDKDNKGYMQYLNKNGANVKAIMVIFSDGVDNDSYASISDARKAIDYLKDNEVLVTFIAFGTEAKDVAISLGIDPKNILDSDVSESELRRAMNILSRSAISASQKASTQDVDNDGGFFNVD